MLEQLKDEVCSANLELVKRGVITYTWGNVSGIDRESGLVVIKPSGLDYSIMCPNDMVVVDIVTGKTVEGKHKPSSDTATHLELYRSFPTIGGVAHSYSINAVAFAQAGMDIPALGTTHADYFYGPIPCTGDLTKEQVENAYELNTGKAIIKCIEERKIDAVTVPGVLVKSHGPFTWGTSPTKAVFMAVVLEKAAEIALETLALNPQSAMQQYILDKHYMRKNGPNAYYGQ